MQNAPVRLAELSGNIDGLQHEGALTDGDGACCLEWMILKARDALAPV